MLAADKRNEFKAGLMEAFICCLNDDDLKPNRFNQTGGGEGMEW